MTPVRSSRSRRLAAACAVSVAVAALGACGSDGSTNQPAGSGSSGTATPVPAESNPPGDIPDNLAFVNYANSAGGYTFTHPEGWARTEDGTSVTFTDKLNGVDVRSAKATTAPTVASAKRSDVPRLKKSETAFELVTVEKASLPAGKGVHIVFRRNSAPDEVTGRVVRDEVEEYAIVSAGRVVRMDLFGPVGADNVDAYRTMSQSLSIS